MRFPTAPAYPKPHQSGWFKTPETNTTPACTLHNTPISGVNPDPSRMKAARGYAGHTWPGRHLGDNSMVSPLGVLAYDVGASK